MNNSFKRYIVFWLSQALSQLGSSMTGFALILWVYTQKETAMTVSLMTFFNYIPYLSAAKEERKHCFNIAPLEPPSIKRAKNF